MKLNFKQWFNEIATSGPYIPGSVNKKKLMGTPAGAPGGMKSIEGDPIKWKPTKKGMKRE